MTEVKAPPPHLLKKFSNQARESSQKRGAANYLKAFATLCIEWAMNSKSTPNFSQIRSSEIEPPAGLVQRWGQQAVLSGLEHSESHWAYEQHIASRAAQYGADQELEACCQFLRSDLLSDGTVERLRSARRPKPPSLKKEALAQLDHLHERAFKRNFAGFQTEAIRRALEALPDD